MRVEQVGLHFVTVEVLHLGSASLSAENDLVDHKS